LKRRSFLKGLMVGTAVLVTGLKAPAARLTQEEAAEEYEKREFHHNKYSMSVTFSRLYAERLPHMQEVFRDAYDRRENRAFDEMGADLFDGDNDLMVHIND